MSRAARRSARLEKIGLDAEGDATRSFLNGTGDANELSYWFAKQMGACFWLGRRSVKEFKYTDAEFEIYTARYFKSLVECLQGADVL